MLAWVGWLVWLRAAGRAGSQAANFGVLPIPTFLPPPTNQAETEAEEGMAVPVPSLSHRPYYLKVGKRGRKEGSEVSGRQRAGQTDFSLSYLALLALHGRRSRPIEVEVMNGGGGRAAAFGYKLQPDPDLVASLGMPMPMPTK